METPANIEGLERLVAQKVQESLHLDYKRGAALGPGHRDELIKDVTAFSNADGGLLIYGIEEVGHIPMKLDGGIPNAQMNREWIDQILSTNIEPPLTDLEIRQIPANSSASYYVIRVAKSFRGPHQASDKKYYKRYNFRSCPMDHYEIFDVANRRSRAPALVWVEVEAHDILFEFTVSNPGTVPASEVAFRLSPGIPWHSKAGPPSPLERGIQRLPPGKKLRFFLASSLDLFAESSRLQKQFSVAVEYFHPEVSGRVGEDFSFDLEDYRGVLVERNELINTLKDGFRLLEKALQSMRQS
jgi:hypothetical protein